MRQAIQLRLGDKSRLLAILSMLLVAGFLGTSVMAYRAAAHAVRASIEERQLPVAAESVYARLQKDLVEPLFVSSMMANDTFLHDWVKAGEKDAEPMRKYLAEIQRRYNTLTSFFVSDASLRYYHPSGVLKTVSPDEWRDAWYYRVRSLAEPYEINVDIDLANADALTVFINYRVIDADGAYLGTAGVGLAVDAMSGMVARLREEYGTAVYFVDEDGAIIAGTPSDLAQAPATTRQAPGLAVAADQALAAGGGSFSYRGRDGSILLHVRWIPELRWYLFVEQNESMSIAGAKQALALNIGLYAAILALALLAVGFTVDRFQGRLERAATHDTLTGALNRLAFSAVAEQALKSSRRSGEPLSAIIMDADDFKRVNDGYGHPEGDKVLVTAVRAAMDSLRDSDLFCRWGGEEFLLLLPGCDMQEALAVAEKVRQAIAQATALSCSIGISMSGGIASLAEDEDMESLVRRADEALLKAKRLGRDRVLCAD
jgi:diguanylate cyclase (GGDEF)-like protein